MIRCDGTKATITLFLNQLKRNNHPKNKQAYGNLLQRKAKIKLMLNLMPLKLFFHLKKIQPEKPEQENVYKQTVYDEYLCI